MVFEVLVKKNESEVIGMSASKCVIISSMPNGGKGALAEYLSGVLGIGILPMGDLIRAEIQAGRISPEIVSHMKKGGLTPDEIVINIINPIFSQAGTERSSLIVEGLPRTIIQARHMLDIFGRVFDEVMQIHLLTPVEECDRRRAERHARLHRDDDSPESFRHRLMLYHEHTWPAILELELGGVRTVRVPVGWNELRETVRERVLQLTDLEKEATVE